MQLPNEITEQLTSGLGRAVTPQRRKIVCADLYCGAGGTTTGAKEALQACGYEPEMTAINHWPVAVATHTMNHPGTRHLCTGLDKVNPRELFKPGELQLLWASPECTHHSVARGGRPINDQSRATAWCVTRFADALLPPVILVENVPEFLTWGPTDRRVGGKPIKELKGAIFRAWVATLESLGYKVEWKILCAADYGDPTTRRRLFVQAQLGRRKIVWPEPTHGPGTPRPWVPASAIIDWTLEGNSIFDRERPLAANTLRRIEEGLREFHGVTIVAMEHGGRALKVTDPLPTITCAKGGAFALAYVLPQQSGGRLRPISEPLPTVATAGAISLIVEYYGNGHAHPVTRPLPTVTCRDRFALVKADGYDVRFRMLQPRELAMAQGFRRDYQFAGNKTEITKQIGNAVPRRLARALVAAAWSQKSNVEAAIRGDDQ